MKKTLLFLQLFFFFSYTQLPFSYQAPSTNIAFNVQKSGYPSPLNSDSYNDDKWTILDSFRYTNKSNYDFI